MAGYPGAQVKMPGGGPTPAPSTRFEGARHVWGRDGHVTSRGVVLVFSSSIYIVGGESEDTRIYEN